MSLCLPMFQPQEMNSGGVTVILGHRGSGKTTLVYDILCHTRRQRPVDLLFCEPQEAQRYVDVVPRSALCREFDLNRLKTVVDAKDDLIHPRLPPSCIVFDGGYGRELLKQSIFKTLFFTARHRNIHVLITLGESSDLCSTLRDAVERWIILRYDGEQCRTRLFQHGRFAPIVTFSSFKEILDKTTSQYDCLVFDRMTEHMARYKADPRPRAEREDEEVRPRKRQCVTAPVSITHDVDLMVNGVSVTVPVHIDVTFGAARVNSDSDV